MLHPKGPSIIYFPVRKSACLFLPKEIRLAPKGDGLFSLEEVTVSLEEVTVSLYGDKYPP